MSEKQHVLYKFLVIREAAGVVSQITQFHGVPEQWNGFEIADWSANKFGDLVDAGWMVLFKPADDQLATFEDDLT